MKIIKSYLVGIILILLFAFRNSNFANINKQFVQLQNDTSSSNIKTFKVFSKKFFSAVAASDTNFLKAHVIFPISNSSFYIFDLKLLHKKIDSKIFFRNLKKLFPDSLVRQINKEGDFSCDKSDKGIWTYVIELSDSEHGIDENISWIFVQENGIFYFCNFKSEAG
jgi:hypothetical protein